MAISEAKHRTPAPAVKPARASSAAKPAPKPKAGADDLYSY